MKKHFKYLIGKLFKITDKPIPKIRNSDLDIQLGQFSEEERNSADKIKSWKSEGLDKIFPEVWKTRKFDGFFCNDVYKKNTKELKKKLQKGDIGITKNYSRITLTYIAAYVYNTLLLNHIKHAIEKIVRKKSEEFSDKSIHNITDSDCQILV